MNTNADDYQYWSNKADRYDAATTCIVGAKALEAANSWLKHQLSATDVALELGCGTGIFSREIAQRVQHLTATDMSQEMLTRAQERLQAYPNVTVECADGYRTQYTEQSFDIVFMGNLVHIVQEPVAVLQESHRLLKSGGRLLLIDFTMSGMPGFARLAMMLRYLSQYGLPQRTNKSYGLSELAALVQGVKFEIRDAQMISRETNVLCLCAAKRGA
jgi:ABC-2 type transport system ATP-binding protein